MSVWWKKWVTWRNALWIFAGFGLDVADRPAIFGRAKNRRVNRTFSLSRTYWRAPYPILLLSSSFTADEAQGG
jgi:hypothetical protein